MFRSSVMQYDLIRSRTNGGKIDSMGRNLHSLIPMFRKGEFDTEETSWDDIQEDYFAGNVVEGMKRRNLLDRSGLVNAQGLLESVTSTNTSSKSKKDDREGKIGSSARPNGLNKGEKDPMEELIKKGIEFFNILNK